MDNELNDKIKEIGSMFGISDIPDNIGEIVSAFLTSSSEKTQDAAALRRRARGKIWKNRKVSALKLVIPIKEAFRKTLI